MEVESRELKYRLNSVNSKGGEEENGGVVDGVDKLWYSGWREEMKLAPGFS
jgi:hypothetical protein